MLKKIIKKILPEKLNVKTSSWVWFLISVLVIAPIIFYGANSILMSALENKGSPVESVDIVLLNFASFLLGVLSSFLIAYEIIDITTSLNPIATLNERMEEVKEKGDVHSCVVAKMCEPWNERDVSLIEKAKERLALNDDDLIHLLIKENTDDVSALVPDISLYKNIRSVISAPKEDLDEFESWGKQKMRLTGGSAVYCIYIEHFLDSYSRAGMEGIPFFDGDDLSKTFNAFFFYFRKDAAVAEPTATTLETKLSNLRAKISKIPDNIVMRALLNAIEGHGDKLSPVVNSRLEKMVSSASDGWGKLNKETREIFLGTCNNITSQISTTEAGENEALNQEIVLQSRVLNSLIK
jgi:hypothetical protein